MFCLLISTRLACAECVSIENVTKCTRLPTFIGGNIGAGDYTENSWRFLYRVDFASDYLHYYSGSAAEIIEKDDEQRLYCYMDYPFAMTIVGYYSIDDQPLITTNPYEACALYLRFAIFREMADVSVLPEEECPSGFYTVPNDMSCDEGFVDVANMPRCVDDTSGAFCVMSSVLPCESGIGTLYTSTGGSFLLWAEKYTSPAICINYKGKTCYVNLAPGGSSGTINILYNGTVYHATN